MNTKRFVIITGMSGAGKTTAIKTLEDMDFFWVDNLPPTLIPKFAQLCSSSGFNKAAIAIDDSHENFSKDLQDSLLIIKELGYDCFVLFLDSADEILVRRFSEHYRKHPDAPQGRILEGIRKERDKLRSIRGIANKIIDTGEMKTPHLKERIKELFFTPCDESNPIIIHLLSFGYKYGIPLDADLIFDTRILPNPFYEQSLQNRDGADNEVQDFVFQDGDGHKLLEYLSSFMQFLIPLYIKRSKTQLTVGIGCTGGRHRSVAVSIKLREFLQSNNYNTTLSHRDIKKS